VNITGPLAVPDTGGWQTWGTITRAEVPLTAGTQVVRLVMDADGASGSVGNFNWVRVRQDQIAPGSFAIIAPPPGVTLRMTSVAFEWTGTGDDFSMNIGTAPGRADVYASGPLGPAIRQTVSPLPLNGSTLYVEVRRRSGGATESVYAQYTAPVRKGLAIIADFSDRSLEDWTVDGMTNLDEVAANLRKLEDHWAWLSHGLEKFQWDIIRIRLTQAAVPGAFSGWGAFRDAVATLATQQVAISDYDVNGDGVLDVSWAIVSAAGVVADAIANYALGGASRNAGVNMFVDGQASTSVKAGATANFTHEIGHLLGLPDLYGQYGTLSSVSIMSFSWPVPPGDFTAYERLTLGWLKPQVVTRTTTGLWLPRATDQISAVKVPTSRPEEYFLIEYRHRPPGGEYGSGDVEYDGLIVFHVLEGSSSTQDPPIVKVEPADGSITPSSVTDPYDFLYPGNARWTAPLILYSYYGDATEVFRIDNVAWVNGGMTFDITIAVQGSTNLLTNGSFESGQAGRPDGWSAWIWVGAPAGFVWPSPTALTGAYSAELHSSFANDKAWTQTVSMVVGNRYVLCGSLKGVDVSGAATVSVLGTSIQSAGLNGSFDWTRRCVAFQSDRPIADVACRIGLSFNLSSGTLWCEDMTLDHLRRAF
jgi:carbohydrate binding protein with CBM6 domain